MHCRPCMLASLASLALRLQDHVPSVGWHGCGQLGAAVAGRILQAQFGVGTWLSAPAPQSNALLVPCSKSSGAGYAPLAQQAEDSEASSDEADGDGLDSDSFDSDVAEVEG